MANRTPEALVARIRDLRRTHSLAEVAALCGVTPNTVLSYARDVAREPCGCGKPGGHKGWCPVMLAKSPRRRATMKEISAGNTKWTVEAKSLVHREWEAGTHEQEIAAQVNHLLGRADISPHAVQVVAGKQHARRPAAYLTRMRSAMRSRWWAKTRAGRNKERWQAALSAIQAPEPPSAPPAAPVVKASKGAPFTMLAMRIEDPLVALRRQQIERAHVGRLTPVMGAT